MSNPRCLEIPRAIIQEGINLCKNNISTFLVTAENLINSNNLDHAAINLEFGIEEFGKILMIKDAYIQGTDPVRIPLIVFTRHENKSERAWKFGDTDAIEAEYKMVSEDGFERSDDGKQGFSRSFSQVINISHFTRMECAFVDFDKDEKIWFLGHKELDRERMQNLLKRIREKTDDVKLT